MGRVAWSWLFVVGCGRLEFDPSTRDAAGAPDGASAACPAFAMLCDGFESGDLSRWSTTTLIGSTSTAQVVAGTARTGTFALEARMPPAGNAGVAAPELDFAMRSSGTLAVREWIDLRMPLVNFDLVLQLGDADVDFAGAGGNDQGAWVATEARAGGSVIDHNTAINAPAIGTWFCLEMVFTFDPARIQIFVDDALVLDEAPITPAPTFDRVLVGGVRLDQLGFDVLVDDVVVADRRIGCQ